ncbi:hypothetical protein Aros01_00273 [Streptosporangium roseum]|uniref:Uncharacterized protein n=1 Tax=Streptosporangium roseum (strain ATCC 12428 / DSM 43021 / JCM 3005 / KCTC 9067 / NCIMB 10171 / NRRL 2505 / NI 9100) TaxID=479432 RepID=D2AZK7_STRRD|nr:hypothetical protein Sros_2270 [Streptosporangium roseum DSM 43021]
MSSGLTTDPVGMEPGNGWVRPSCPEAVSLPMSSPAYKAVMR